jgi:hypothetical protein
VYTKSFGPIRSETDGIVQITIRHLFRAPLHVSDFVNKVTGRLIVRNKDGVIIKDAQQVIYPGSKDDPWWDVEQLLS